MTRIDTAKSPYQAIMGRIPMACFVVAIMSASSEAQFLYDFVEFPSGDVLARLELTSLPATHAEVATLTFTPSSKSIFGYDTQYSGSFDTSFAMFLDDGVGGLQGNGGGISIGSVGDNNPPPGLLAISVHPLRPSDVALVPVNPVRLSLAADDNLNEDMIKVFYFHGDVGTSVERVGDWRLVPEPSSIGLCLTAILFGVGLGRTSKRNTNPPSTAPV